LLNQQQTSVQPNFGVIKGFDIKLSYNEMEK